MCTATSKGPLADQIQHPQHPWQSWRDRYLRQLRDRRPSAFNLPDNALPSPPSDHPPTRRPPPAPASPKQPKKATSKDKQPQRISKGTGQDRIRDVKNDTAQDYSIAQLEATFSPEDWEELYAFVDIIQAQRGGPGYHEAWQAWAEAQENQTLEQWRQYYEKVVFPQWERDPVWKREQINKKVEAKHEKLSAAARKSGEQQQQVSEVESVEEATVMPPPGAKNASIGDKAPRTETKVKTEARKPSSEEAKLLSSSTAQHESPKYIADIYETQLKRVRGGNVLEEEEQPAHPPKRRKSESPDIDRSAQQEVPVGTEEKPLEIYSSQSSASVSQMEVDDERARAQLRHEAEEAVDEDVTLIGHNFEEMPDNKSVTSDDDVDFDRPPLPPQGLDPSGDNLPSDTPTPRASRHRPSNFDTQAILSSPSQPLLIASLPRPVGYTQDLQTQTEHRSSSMVPHPESEASTTQSIEEFRRISNGDHDTKPLPSPSPSYSPAPSSDSDDPDPPLEAEEIDEFFAHFNEQGFPDNFIVAALKRTRFRPELAELVLDAWKNGKPLPRQRGIWSVEEDEAVQHGDGGVLEKLEEKHTLDGWGGITERILFLEGYNSR